MTIDKKDQQATLQNLIDPDESEMEQTSPTPAPALPPLPDGWTQEDIRFLLGELEHGPLLVADTRLGIPTIHSPFGAEVVHCGFGLMCVRTDAFTLHFDAGGAMARTPSGKGWTRLSIEGSYDYDSGAVREKLLATLDGKVDDPHQEVADPDLDTREQEAAEQAREFTRSLGQFYGTQGWHRYPALCPHLVLLTDGARYVAEHGGRDGGTACWLFEAIASYQDQAALKRQPFQVWKLVVHPQRQASLICSDGNALELARQEIERTDFLPVGELTLYASLEEQPELSTTRKTLIILLPTEY
jgi:hypothetical protein